LMEAGPGLVPRRRRGPWFHQARYGPALFRAMARSSQMDSARQATACVLGPQALDRRPPAQDRAVRLHDLALLDRAGRLAGRSDSAWRIVLFRSCAGKPERSGSGHEAAPDLERVWVARVASSTARSSSD